MLYIFAGRKRKNSVADCLRQLAKQVQVNISVTELDIQRSAALDFTQPQVQRRWLQRLDAGEFDCLVVTPPCSTFSRACWANDRGPFPVRSQAWPRGFPWNKSGRHRKAFLGTVLADFSFEAMKRQLQHRGYLGLMEQPEDLGRTKYQRVPGHIPASMWQFPQVEQLLAMPNVMTVVFPQAAFGASSPKPTRFLMRRMGELHPSMREGLPTFDDEGWYTGPLERTPLQPGQQQLIGRDQHGFRTSPSAAWPPALCQWVASQMVDSLVKSSGKRGINQSNEGEERKKQKTQDAVDDKEEQTVDPMDPPLKGGFGKPRVCEWKGMEAPFHDGGCLSSPGRWARPWRRFPEEEEWKELRRSLLRTVCSRAGSILEVEKEAYRMAKGGSSFGLVRDEHLLAQVREEMAGLAGLRVEEVVAAEGQPFFLGLMAGLLEKAGDGDHKFLREAEVGLPVGVLHPLPRTPVSFEAQTKWPGDGEDYGEVVLEKSNYPSASEYQKHLEDHLEKEVGEGLMEKMSEDDFIKEFGENRAVAALAVLVEDEQGKKRVIHDGSHGVQVNQRIRCRDKIRMPCAREKRALLEEYEEEGAIVLSLVGDFEAAHRRFKYMRDEQGFLACKCRSDSPIVYINLVGTFGITSTPYWWTRLSGALIRLTHYLLGSDWLVDMLLYADDLEVMGPGRGGRIGSVLAFVFMAALGAPFKWKKQRGGLSSEWIGIMVDYSTYEMGLSIKRSEWICEWIRSLEDRGRVGWREFAAGLGRLGFSALALPWERPFLGPLYNWAAAIRGNHGELEIPWAVRFILGWIRKKMEAGRRMEKVSSRRKYLARPSKRIWTDAKATDQDAWIGGWLEEDTDTKKCSWFSAKVSTGLAPWLLCRGGNPKRVIASLEFLATLIAMKLWCCKDGSDAVIRAEAFTDNKGNDFVLKKGMSTKYPLTLLVMEASEMMRKHDFIGKLSWVSRDHNQGADDLTNEVFDRFSMDRRVNVDDQHLQWEVLGDLMVESANLYKEITERKKLQRGGEHGSPKSGKKKAKFFKRWSS